MRFLCYKTLQNSVQELFKHPTYSCAKTASLEASIYATVEPSLQGAHYKTVKIVATA